jgi:hypothetical protein
MAPEPLLASAHQKQLDIFRNILRRAGGGSDGAVNAHHLSALERLVAAASAPHKETASTLAEPRPLLVAAATRAPASQDPAYCSAAAEDAVYDRALSGWMQAHPVMRRACGSVAANQAPWAAAKQQQQQQQQKQQRHRRPTAQVTPASAGRGAAATIEGERNPKDHADASSRGPQPEERRCRDHRPQAAPRTAPANISPIASAATSAARAGGGGGAGGVAAGQLLVLPLATAEQLEVQLAVLRNAMARVQDHVQSTQQDKP